MNSQFMIAIGTMSIAYSIELSLYERIFIYKLDKNKNITTVICRLIKLQKATAIVM